MSAPQETVDAAFNDLDKKVADYSEATKKRHYARHKERRGYVSDNDLMFEHLCDQFGFDADERAGLHLFVARAMDIAPDEKLIINELEVGGLLPGDDDVTDESLRRRCRRLFERIDERQRAAGRMVIDRIPGKYSTGTKKNGGREVLVGPEYRVWFTQAIAESVEAARALRLPGRRERFRQAAHAVFEGAVFPACAPKVEPAIETPYVRTSDEIKIEVDPAETYETIIGEKPLATVKFAEPKRESAQRPPRMIRRFKDNAALALKRAAEKGEGALILQATTLYVELGREVEKALGGDADDTISIIRQVIALLQTVLNSPSDLSSIETSIEASEAKEIQNSAENAARTSDTETANVQQKRNFDPQSVDTGVQHKETGKRVSKEFIDEVRARADIVQVVSTHVQLERRGAEYVGCCLFHEEKTGSFSVNPAKGLYHCFGCAAKGDVFKFVQEIEGVQFRDAVKAVAERSGVGWPEEYENKRESARAETPRTSSSSSTESFAENVEVFEI